MKKTEILDTMHKIESKLYDLERRFNWAVHGTQGRVQELDALNRRVSELEAKEGKKK